MAIEIDLKSPTINTGFTDEERKNCLLLDSGFADTFRHFYPDTERYSWWTYRFGARKRNAGWRIDYFVVSDRLQSHLRMPISTILLWDQITVP